MSIQEDANKSQQPFKALLSSNHIRIFNDNPATNLKLIHFIVELIENWKLLNNILTIPLRK